MKAPKYREPIKTAAHKKVAKPAMPKRTAKVKTGSMSMPSAGRTMACAGMNCY